MNQTVEDTMWGIDQLGMSTPHPLPKDDITLAVNRIAPRIAIRKSKYYTGGGQNRALKKAKQTYLNHMAILQKFSGRASATYGRLPIMALVSVTLIFLLEMFKK